MLMRRPLTQLLTSPSKVAHALDWNKTAGGTILNLCIVTPNRIDLAIATHPSTQEPLQTLPSIPLQTQVIPRTTSSSSSSSSNAKKDDASQTQLQRIVAPSVAHELHHILMHWNVCGVVVNWPVQPEGWCGAPCGRVLFVLDHLTTTTTAPTLAPSKNTTTKTCSNGWNNRPICLWDDFHHHHNVPYEDEWGRSPVYAEVASNPTQVHFASKEQYEAHPTSVHQVWDDFTRAHWPEYFTYTEYHERSSTSASTSLSQNSNNGMRMSPSPRLNSNPSSSNPNKPWLSTVPTLSSKYDTAWLDDDLP